MGQSRNENILENILGASNPLGAPQSREEALLMQLLEKLDVPVLKWLGVTTTELTDGATTNPITIDGKSVTATAGDSVAYGSKEFSLSKLGVWQEWGDLSNAMTKTNPTGTGSFSLNRHANTTVGDYSVAVGHDTSATASCSYAEGDSTSASGSASHAEGKDTWADGSYSHAEGFMTTANHRSQHVFGEWNITDDSTADKTVKGKYIEIVGNGTGNMWAINRSNARTLDWDGNETIAGDLIFKGNRSLEAALGKTLTGTLTAGQTSVTISDESIVAGAVIDIFTDVYDVKPTNVAVTTGSITLTFVEQGADIYIKVKVM